MTTWAQKLRVGTMLLADAGLPSPDVDARLIAEWIVSQVPLGHQTITVADEERFDKAISRRATNEPVQHIIGRMWFRYLELISRPGAFIVRPETEMVTQAGLDAVTAMQKKTPIVVDLCTGSGAIALAVATEIPTSRVWGVERDATAFAVAEENNARYGKPVTLIHDDARTALPELNGKVDVCISNPPYVPQEQNLPADVYHDPPQALYGGGVDGLDVPRELVIRAFDMLRPGGVLVMEHGDNQGSALVTHARRCGFYTAHTGVDLTGRDRWLYAEKGKDDR
ncbi:peptide chain release factor N(5)-glutamine methyltransferase [Arcanobacterium buesumense]|uniref:peptide chain release factor N(5)-glutamine methyltransferase n=1 Tax=Arcanobacterium buesumense TaxID=2722751 RepID=A0A6H2EJ61_9ACTO|nr:peptide chain release factor N(5)-glutamine methyltransferase [Arcanobacterium buesumense]QJC21366.1 peptide chain release factor N(5)-glutamine methyltransferase [Arcanobacterium buesumense]